LFEAWKSQCINNWAEAEREVLFNLSAL
jgi:hypothetical protein